MATNELEEALVELLSGAFSDFKQLDSNAYAEMQEQYGNQVVSDYKQKKIQALASRSGNDFTPEELMFIAQMAGPDKFGRMLTESDADDWGDSVLGDYAEHLRNYLYTYKNSARAVDPSIDPREQHIGIMAQDLEQVNPACVKETPDGTKVVDTGRLALMNAGAIGDLAREIKELKEVIHGR